MALSTMTEEEQHALLAQAVRLGSESAERSIVYARLCGLLLTAVVDAAKLLKSGQTTKAYETLDKARVATTDKIKEMG